ncbi:MAG: T9SS type A sorting domain-containing protein, partial [Bacteroidia bacterium]|nr:T9SS type A sorting domain-containing protein [Bacteroidia bacterium]
MKKIYAFAFASIFATALNAQTPFWTPTTYKGAFPITDGTAATDWTSGWANWDPENTNYGAPTTTVSGNITTNTTWTAGTIVNLQNKVYVKNNAVLTIEPGVIVRGDKNTEGTLIITKGAKIIAAGTASNPIVFTSGEAAGNRAEGDWGGVVVLGYGKNNQPGGVANIEGLAVSADTEFGGNDDTDSSGVFTYCRIEFSGIALQPNKETNGITMGSVGSRTIMHHVQVSFGGDDGFEWFGGAIDAKYLISFRNLDDDFDCDFGWKGRVQFGLIIKDSDLFDAAGDSNGFECDNDATGSNAMPRTQAIFSNITNIGPLRNGTVTLPVGEKFERAIYLRRNTAISIFNSIHSSWEKGIYIKDAGTVDNFTTNDSAVFANNIITSDIVRTITVDANASQSFYSTIFTNDNNDSTTTTSQIAWVNAFPVALNSAPDYRLQPSSVAATGASFSDAKFDGQILTGIEDNTLALSSYSLFPNPATENISIAINLGIAAQVQINIYDITGKVIAQPMNQKVDAGATLVKVDVESISSGLYFAN